MKCPICWGEDFVQKIVLKQRLIDEWELNEDEVSYINKQQGLVCKECSCSLRTMTLADSLLNHFNIKSKFQNIRNSKIINRIRLLEINSAGGLHPYLQQLKNSIFVKYPEVDIQNLPYKDNYFDLIVHSDTLEHVPNSLLGLKECYRVLKTNGCLFYTIPIVHGRLSRRRDSLKNSYHGNQDETQGEDYKVIMEYGADFWIEIFNSGFTEVTISTIEDLSSLAIKATKKLKKESDIQIFSPVFRRSLQFIRGLKIIR